MPDTPLDPDQVPCPRCGARAGVACRQPSGERAKAIHVARRRAANPTPPAPDRNRTPRGNNPNGPPMDARARGGRAAQQARRRRKAELAASVEAQRVAAETAALEAEAAKLAEDASRYARDRAVLRRHVLDGAALAYERLVESLTHIERVVLDDDGRPLTTPVERTDRAGNLRTEEVPDKRGAWSTDQVERLAKVAASALVSLRLEEGKPTGIERLEGPAGDLSDADVDDLIRIAGITTPKGPTT